MRGLRDLTNALGAIMGKGPSAVEKVRGQAEALAAQQRYAEAIEYATTENRRLHDPWLERQLARWRHEGFAACPVSSPRPDWPPVIADPFPDTEGPPEIRGAGALTSERLGGCILHHGCLIVRGLFSPGEAQELKSGIDKAIEAREQAKRSQMPENGIWYSPLPLPENPEDDVPRRYFVEIDNGLWMADSPHMLFAYTGLIKAKGIDRVIGGYLGEHPVTSVGKSTLRRLPPTTRPGDWHQDGAFLGAATRTVNLWLTLSHCGDDAPGLDMVPRRLDDLVETGTHGANFDWTVGDALVKALANGRSTASPIFEPGDAILFDHLFLHRTAGCSRMSKERYAIENWFFAPSVFPTSREGLLL
jgi:hypothetical protein